MQNLRKEFHPSQVKTFQQQLILVDFKDKFQKSIGKLDAHLNTFNFSKNALPHRAFSLFLFDSSNRLLLQQRSEKKITFPLLWANTCCSHQLHHPDENDDLTKYQKSEYYVRERMKAELNFDLNNIELSLIQKIIYSAKGDEYLSEYELDYIYFAKIKEQQPKINFNKDEVNDVKWLNQDELKQFNIESNKQFTPWFKLIYESNLLKWWNCYHNNINFMQSEKIEKLN